MVNSFLFVLRYLRLTIHNASLNLAAEQPSATMRFKAP